MTSPLWTPLAGDVPDAGEMATFRPIFARLTGSLTSANDGADIGGRDITGLSMPIYPGRVFYTIVVVRYTATGTGTDISINRTMPAGVALYGVAPGQSTTVAGGFNPLFTGDVPFAGSFGADTGVAYVAYQGIVDATGAAAPGTFQMTYARATAVAGQTTSVLAGSFLMAFQAL